MHMKKGFMATYGKIMEHALTGKDIWTQVSKASWLLVVLVKIQVHNLRITIRLHVYVFQFKPVKHGMGKKTFCK